VVELDPSLDERHRESRHVTESLRYENHKLNSRLEREVSNTRRPNEGTSLLKQEVFSLTLQLEQLTSSFCAAHETQVDISSCFIIDQASAMPVNPHPPLSGQGETSGATHRFMEEDQ
ncbi:hypothetical protein AMTR_s00090p00150670, partial [Amborella trichopoda]